MTAPVIISRVLQADSQLVDAFARLLPQLTSAPIPDTAEIQAMLDSQSVLLVGRDASGRIMGAGTLGVFRTPSGMHAHIEDVVVDEALRGQGLGEALVRALLEHARAMGLKGVSLTCNPRRAAANRLYQKMGFQNWQTNAYWYGFEVDNAGETKSK